MERKPDMTPEQTTHMLQLNAEFSNLFKDKYRAGQEEHGGDLWNKDPLLMCIAAKEEVADQWAYISVIEETLRRWHLDRIEALALLREADRASQTPEWNTRAERLLNKGVVHRLPKTKT
jgi:hypothetical protein